MAADFLEGDVLTKGGKSYAIRRAQPWVWRYGRGADRLFYETGATTRDGASNLTAFAMTPLDPADANTVAELAQMYGTDTPFQPLVAFVRRDGVFWRLVVEEHKR